MKKFRTWLAYGFYVFVLGVFFVYILFPAEAVNRYIVARVAAEYPDVLLTIGDVSPILPPGLKLQQVVISRYRRDALKAREVRLYPRWLSLLGKRPTVAFSAAAGQGMIKGTAAAAGKEIQLDADLESVRIERLDLPQAFSDYHLEGAVSGKIRYTGGSRPAADVQLTVADMTVAPPRPVLGVRKLRFENVRTDATLDNRNLEVTRLILAGKQVSGEMSGDVALTRRLPDSRLSLSGTLQLNLRASGTGPAFQPDQSAGGGIGLTGRVPVRIHGTLGKPIVSLR